MSFVLWILYCLIYKFKSICIFHGISVLQQNQPIVVNIFHVILNLCMPNNLPNTISWKDLVHLAELLNQAKS